LAPCLKIWLFSGLDLAPWQSRSDNPGCRHTDLSAMLANNFITPMFCDFSAD